MFLSSLIEELCTKEENDKTGCKLNFGHECTLKHCNLVKYKQKQITEVSFKERIC